MPIEVQIRPNRMWFARSRIDLIRNLIINDDTHPLPFAYTHFQYSLNIITSAFFKMYLVFDEFFRRLSKEFYQTAYDDISFAVSMLL